jgi:hypothetical protein
LLPIFFADEVLYLLQTQEAKTFQKGKAEQYVQNMQQLSQLQMLTNLMPFLVMVPTL